MRGCVWVCGCVRACISRGVRCEGAWVWVGVREREKEKFRGETKEVVMAKYTRKGFSYKKNRRREGIRWRVRETARRRNGKDNRKRKKDP